MKARKITAADIEAMPQHPKDLFASEERIRALGELEVSDILGVAGGDAGELMTVAPYDVGPSDANLYPMNEPIRVDDGVYEVYECLGYTIQRSDQVGYTDRWFVFRERRPFRAWLRKVDGKLHTFGSLDEAVAWLTQNPEALPEIGQRRQMMTAESSEPSPNMQP